MILLAATLASGVGPNAPAQAQEDGPTRPRRGFRGGRGGDDGAPKVGEVAPLFSLKVLQGKRRVDLASFRDKRPVILLFGSYT